MTSQKKKKKNNKRRKNNKRTKQNDTCEVPAALQADHLLHI
jgi:hypothetical protein